MQTPCGSSCVRTSTFTWTRTSAPRSTRTRPVITQCRPGDINRDKRATAPALPTRIDTHTHTHRHTHTLFCSGITRWKKNVHDFAWTTVKRRKFSNLYTHIYVQGSSYTFRSMRILSSISSMPSFCFHGDAHRATGKQVRFYAWILKKSLDVCGFTLLFALTFRDATRRRTRSTRIKSNAMLLFRCLLDW